DAGLFVARRVELGQIVESDPDVVTALAATRCQPILVDEVARCRRSDDTPVRPAGRMRQRATRATLWTRVQTLRGTAVDRFHAWRLTEASAAIVDTGPVDVAAVVAEREGWITTGRNDGTGRRCHC